MKKIMKPKSGIRRKIILLICSVTMVMMAMGLSLGYFLGYNLLRNTVEEDSGKMAQLLAVSIEQLLNKEIVSLEAYSTSFVCRDAIKENNLKYEGMDEEYIRQYLVEMDKKWLASSTDSSFIRGYLDNVASERLRAYVEKENDLKELFITDKFGGLVAASSRTSDFYQADERWWQEAFAGGKGKAFMGDIEFDESANTWAIVFATPLRDKKNNVIGVCKAIISSDIFFGQLDKFRIGKTGHALIIDKKCNIMFHRGVGLPSPRYCDERDFRHLYKNKVKGLIIDNSYLHKEKMFVVFAEIKHPLLLEREMGWMVAVERAVEEVFLPLRLLIFQMAGLTIILLVILMPVGFIFGGMFVRPIVKLHNAIREIKEGNLNYSLEEFKTGDEIEECANSFNEMVLNIKEKQKEIFQQKTYSESIISSMNDVLIVVTPEGLIKSVNKAACDLLGYTEEELIGQAAEMIFEEKEEMPLKGMKFKKLIEEGFIRDYNIAYMNKFGERIPISFSGSVMKDRENKIVGIVNVAHDMRQIRRLIEKEQELTIATREIEARKRVEEALRESEAILQVRHHYLEITNEKHEIDNLLKEIIAVTKEFTGCAAIGVRILDEQGNIPYTAYDGFSKSFYESESPLSIHDDQCMCINVVKGTTDSKFPFYTPGGSFYMNATTRFLATVSEEDKGKTRNKCNEAGYESVALIPIRAAEKVLGLIHLADHKENMVPLKIVEMLEDVGRHLGITLKRIVAEAELQKRESWLSTTFGSVGDGLIATDNQGRVVFVNPVAQLLTGWKQEEAKDLPLKSIFNIISEETGKEVGDIVAKVLREGTVVGLGNHTILIAKDGARRPIDDSAAPIKDNQGNFIGAILVFRDVTERRNAEKKLQEAVRAKSAFTSMVSHELRTPLAALKESVSLVSEGMAGPVNQEQQKFLNIAKSNADRLARLINEVLDFQTLEFGKMTFKMESCDINDAVKEVREMMHPLAKEKNLDFTLNLDENLPKIRFDRDKIIQVLTNLVNNSLKLTEKGGVIITTSLGENIVQVSVKDTGPGIREEDMSRLFRQYEQLERKVGGTGLGLAISLGVIKAHGGKIWAESKFGEGTTFHFVLPIEERRTV